MALRAFLRVSVVAVLVTAAAGDAIGQDQQSALPGPTGVSGQFGTSVAVEAGVMLVGSPGTAQVFPYALVGGVWIADGPPLAGTVGSRFGEAVALAGGLAAIGIPNETVNGLANAGRVEIYKRTAPATWSFQNSLQLATPIAQARFGHSVDTYGGTRVLVGAPGHSNGIGRAIVFRDLGFGLVQEQILAPSGFSAGAQFGHAVAITLDELIVGAPFEDRQGFTDNGAVMLFTKKNGATSWTSAGPWSYAASNCHTGTSVDIDHGRAILGSPGILNHGQAGLLKWNGSAFVNAPEMGGLNEAKTGDRFGTRVAIVGDDIWVTAPGHSANAGATQHGAVRHYDWNLPQFAFLADTVFYDLGEEVEGYGTAFAVSGTQLVVGAPAQPGTSADEGRVIAYDYGTIGWKWQGYGVGLGGTAPIGPPNIIGKGSLFATEPFALRTESSLPNAPILLFIGFTQINVSFGPGSLLVSPNIVVSGFSTDANGDFELKAPFPPGVPSGFQFHSQFLLVVPNDPLVPNGVLATRGLTGTTP